MDLAGLDVDILHRGLEGRGSDPACEAAERLGYGLGLDLLLELDQAGLVVLGAPEEACTLLAFEVKKAGDKIQYSYHHALKA